MHATYRGRFTLTDMQPPPTIPPPVATGGRVLYLDFDGVLHPEDVRRRAGRGPYIASPSGHVLFEHAPLLADVLRAIGRAHV